MCGVESAVRIHTYCKCAPGARLWLVMSCQHATRHLALRSGPNFGADALSRSRIDSVMMLSVGRSNFGWIFEKCRVT